MNEKMKNIMQSSIETAYRNRNLGIDDIVQLAMVARECYGIDRVIIHTNRTYKYLLEHIVTCGEDGAQFFQNENIAMTTSQYEEMVADYLEHPVSEKALEPIAGIHNGSLLHTGIIREGRYFGSIAFWNENAREWNEEVKRTLEDIAHIMYLFMSMYNMMNGFNYYKMMRQELQRQDILSGFFLNLRSGELHAIKLVPFLQKIISEWSSYSDMLDEYGECWLDATHCEQLRVQFSLEALRENLSAKQSVVQMEYPHMSEDGVMWVVYKVELIKSDVNGRPESALVTFCDNTDAVQQHALLESMAKAKRRIDNLEERNQELSTQNKKTRYLLEHDTLTGAWNRKGYQRILGEYKRSDVSVAYIQIDVDNFKHLNDTYGHEFGDKVLKGVASQLAETFRAEDYVFRFGGDEFAVLLTNFRGNAWESIAHKQRLLHIRLNQILKKHTYVTLSMGITWSESGFYDEMITLADAALYETKANGRSGCCVFDESHSVVYEWHDEIGLDTGAGSRLGVQNNVGECRIEFQDNNWEHGRLICNEPARVIMGFAPEDTPEECFIMWLRRVDPFYRETLRKARDVMMEQGQAECTYLYQHPTRGKTKLRSGGRCLKNDKGIVFYGYHQSLQDTNIVMGQDDSQRLIDAMTAVYFASYYVSLEENWYCIFKSTAESRHLDKQDVPATVAVRTFVETLVQPDYREAMHEFCNFNKLADRLKDREFVEAEYLSMVADKGWCRMRMLAVKRDDDGKVTHFQIFVASIDKQKRAAIEQANEQRRAMELQLHVGEIVSRTKIRSVGFLDRATGEMELCEDGVVRPDGIKIPFAQMKEWGLAHAYGPDCEEFAEKFDLAYIESQIKANGTCVMEFREEYDLCEIKKVVHHYEVYDHDPTKLLAVIEDITDFE